MTWKNEILQSISERGTSIERGGGERSRETGRGREDREKRRGGKERKKLKGGEKKRGRGRNVLLVNSVFYCNLQL